MRKPPYHQDKGAVKRDEELRRGLGTLEVLGIEDPWNVLDLNVEEMPNAGNPVRDEAHGCHEADNAEDVGVLHALKEAQQTAEAQQTGCLSRRSDKPVQDRAGLSREPTGYKGR